MFYRKFLEIRGGAEQSLFVKNTVTVERKVKGAFVCNIQIDRIELNNQCGGGENMQISTRLSTDEARYIINQTSRLHGLSNLMLKIKTDMHIRRGGQW